MIMAIIKNGITLRYLFYLDMYDSFMAEKKAGHKVVMIAYGLGIIHRICLRTVFRIICELSREIDVASSTPSAGPEELNPGEEAQDGI